jgi:hypothetical protein
MRSAWLVRKGQPEMRLPQRRIQIDYQACSSSSNGCARFRSSVSKRSVYQGRQICRPRALARGGLDRRRQTRFLRPARRIRILASTVTRVTRCIIETQ